MSIIASEIAASRQSKALPRRIIAFRNAAALKSPSQLLFFGQGGINRFVKLDAPARIGVRLDEGAVPLRALAERVFCLFPVELRQGPWREHHRHRLYEVSLQL
jgi:hypothetical protein